jgi:hypothetical protein
MKDYLFFIGLLAAVVVVVLVVKWWLGRKKHRLTLPRPTIHFTPTRTVAEEIGKLRQNLRIKVGWDEVKIDRLIDLEREIMPNASLQVLMESAIERWERDNR